MDYASNVNYYLNLVKRERELVRAELKRYPGGKLMISREKSGTVYYHVFVDCGNKHRRRITKEKELIKKLARKEYLLDYRDRLDKCAEALSECKAVLEKNSNESAAANSTDNYSMLPIEFIVSPLISSIKLHQVESNEIQCNGLYRQVYGMSPDEWMSLPYRVNTFRVEEKKHRSSCGVMMRSKGEIAWAERLLHWGVAFHHDELLFFAGEWISPDFIVMRRDGKLFYIEHCGLMDDEKYRRNHKRKLDLYESGGVVPWDNLIVTYDRSDGSIDVEMIDAIIKSRLL